MPTQKDSGRPSGTGEGWRDTPYPETLRDSLVQKIGEQQRRVAAIPKCDLNEQVDRGQHQKLLLGALGTLRIFDGTPLEVRSGVFSEPFVVPVACRFSNGQPCTQPDKKPDVRGVALKFFSPQGTEADLLMTNEGGRTHAPDPVQFMAFADFLIAGLEPGLARGLRELLEEFREHTLTVRDFIHMLAVLGREVLIRSVFHKVHSLSMESYWGSVVRLGNTAFKYSLHPHKTTESLEQPSRGHRDYLREELLSRLARGPVKWELRISLFVDEHSTSVEDASKVWKSDSIPIGELEISSAASEEDERQINQMAFNPGNGFEPLGITHTRKDVYAASAANRASRGLLSSDEARGFLAVRP